MKPALIVFSSLCFATISAPAALIFADNFNAPDTGNLDLSDQTGRRSGLDTAIQVRSSRIQHGISSNQLNFLNAGTGRVRFHNDLDNNNTTAEGWHDWATGAPAALILASGGMRVEFDWIAGNNTSGNWVAFNVGHNGEIAGEPAFRVNEASNDLGILFRFSGQTEIFDNGVNLGPGGSATPPVIGLRHIMIDYSFNSFADGSPVVIQAWSDAQQLYSGSFTWNGNAGQLYMELETLENTLIDNVSVSTIPEPSGMVLGALCGLGLMVRRRK